MTYKLAISKPGKDVLTTTNPSDLIFSSEFNTLKYETVGTISVTVPAGYWAASTTITHALGYYPYIDVYVTVDGGSEYRYCPFYGAGATVQYSATAIITTSDINFYAYVDGGASTDWTFTFKYFIYKNNLNL